MCLLTFLMIKEYETKNLTATHFKFIMKLNQFYMLEE